MIHHLKNHNHLQTLLQSQHSFSIHSEMIRSLNHNPTQLSHSIEKLNPKSCSFCLKLTSNQSQVYEIPAQNQINQRTPGLHETQIHAYLTLTLQRKHHNY